MAALTPNPPRTLMEVYKMLPEGTCAELIRPYYSESDLKRSFQ